jgi:hypothetical protein
MIIDSILVIVLILVYNCSAYILNYPFKTICSEPRFYSSIYNPVAALSLTTRFDRWKFLQQTLEGETFPLDVNRVLYFTLKPWHTNRVQYELSSSPQLSSRQYESLKMLMDIHDDTGMIEALVLDHGFYQSEQVSTTLKLLETLHPDPQEDEDAFKSCWDLVVELYGKEATKVAERNGDIDWKVRCSVVRLLIHFDFLIQDPV